MLKRFLAGLALGVVFGATLVGACAPRRVEAEPEVPPGTSATRDSRRAVHITPEMRRYSLTRYALYFASGAASALVFLLLLRSGVNARIADLAERRGRNGLVRAYLYFPLLMLASGTLLMPLTFYSQFLLPREYGLSTQTLGGWLEDEAKGFGLTALVGSPVVALLYWTIRRSPRRWWVGFWLASVPLLTASVVLGPLVIDPLFNRYQPLRNERLRERILALAARAGIERGRVYEVDASRRTKEVNAYVTGLFGSARIVLWDTTLQRLDDREVLFVMAHEMGHYVKGDVPLLLLVSSAGSLVLFALVDRIGRALIARFGRRWGVEQFGELGSLPVLALVGGLLTFAGSPVSAAISRAVEARADTFALRLTNDGEAGATSFVKLSEMNLSLPDPPPFITFWLFTHPPLQERIEKAQRWEDTHPLPAADDGERPPVTR